MNHTANMFLNLILNNNIHLQNFQTAISVQLPHATDIAEAQHPVLYCCLLYPKPFLNVQQVFYTFYFLYLLFQIYYLNQCFPLWRSPRPHYSQRPHPLCSICYSFSPYCLMYMSPLQLPPLLSHDPPDIL